MAKKGKKPLSVRFWGVRGSCATPGATTVRTGGNTSCVEVRVGDQLFIFDMGTGMRPLGAQLVKAGQLEAQIFVSHVHWDHIQGLPFFAPAFVPGNKLSIHVETKGKYSGAGAFNRQMSYPNFPVTIEGVFRADLEFHDVKHGVPVKIGDVSVTPGRLNHPDDALGYRLECGGQSIVYATDTEHTDSVDPNIKKLADGADVLIYDAQYTPDEYANGKRGWGHSTWAEGVKLAKAASVKNLYLFHHDPTHDDGFMDELEKRVRQDFPATFVAREGTLVEV